MTTRGLQQQALCIGRGLKRRIKFCHDLHWYHYVYEKFIMLSSIRSSRFKAALTQTSFGWLTRAFSFFAQATMAVALAFSAFTGSANAAQNLAAIALSDPGAGVPENMPAKMALSGKIANFRQELPTPESQKLADWVMDSSDNNKLPFAIVDKVNARVFVFDAQGQIRGAASVLLGLAVGDDSVPGIGQRKLSSIKPEERTTPAGRFVASLDRDIHGQEVLWVDYDTAVSLHPVVKGTPKERRAERLASSSTLDKRISYGCINVPVRFYEQVVSPTFTGTNGIVYVLPETRSAQAVFGSYDVQEVLRQPALTGAAHSSNAAAR